MTNRNDRESDIFAGREEQKKHRKSRKRRHAPRPCGGNAPNVPANLSFEWDTTEKQGRGRRLVVLLGWDPVRTNTSGAASTMRRYTVQMQRSLDGGVTRAGKTRRYVVVETTVRKVTAASIVSGTTAEYTLDKAHDLDAGDTIIVSGMTPGGYNGTFTVLAAGLTATTYRADIGSSPGAGTAFGEAHEQTTTVEVRSIRKHAWYRFRVKAENTTGCVSEWSSWTSWTLANDHVAPPSPLLVKIYAASTNRVVVDWDTPVVYLPIEGTVAATGTTTLTGTGTFFDAQVSLGDVIRIGLAGDVRTVTAIASDTSLTVDTAHGTFSGQVCYTSEPDPDVAGYDVWLDTVVGFTPPAYKRDPDHHSTRISFRIPDADAGLTFYGRVKSFDASGNRSKFIPATIAGNSASGTTPDGVTLGSGGGGAVATWSKVGRSRVKHYANRRWTNTTGRRLTFKKARATCGDKDLSSGAPTGSSLKFNLRRWVAAESSHAPVFDNGAGGDDDDRLKIDAGTYKDVNGPSTFSITYLDPDEAVTVKVTNVGSTYPGDDWTVQLFMEP